MKELLIKLLDSYVKESNPKVDSFHVYVLGTSGPSMYVIQVRSWYDLTKEEKDSIRGSVSRAFNFLGLPKDIDFMVTYARMNKK